MIEVLAKVNFTIQEFYLKNPDLINYESQLKRHIFCDENVDIEVLYILYIFKSKHKSVQTSTKEYFRSTYV